MVQKKEEKMNLNRLWGGVFQVGKNEYINFGNQITIEGVNYTSYRKITLGSPSLFLSDPVGALFYLEYNVPNGVPDNLNGPPNSSADLDLINVRRDANGETMNGAGGVLRVAFGAGGNWNGYTLQVVGAGYKKGDILKVNNQCIMVCITSRQSKWDNICRPTNYHFRKRRVNKSCRTP